MGGGLSRTEEESVDAVVPAGLLAVRVLEVSAPSKSRPVIGDEGASAAPDAKEGGMPKGRESVMGGSKPTSDPSPRLSGSTARPASASNKASASLAQSPASSRGLSPRAPPMSPIMSSKFSSLPVGSMPPRALLMSMSADGDSSSCVSAASMSTATSWSSSIFWAAEQVSFAGSCNMDGMSPPRAKPRDAPSMPRAATLLLSKSDVASVGRGPGVAWVVK